MDVEEAGRLLLDPKTYLDEPLLYRASAVLRAGDPVHRIAHPEYPETTILTRHADVVAVAKDNRQWLQGKPQALKTYQELRALSGMRFPQLRFLVNMDGAEHRAYRSITASWFQPRNLKRLQDRLDELAVEAFDRMAAAGERCDFAEEVAIPYPMQVILALLGLPEEDYALVLRLTQQMLSPSDPDFEVSPGAGSAITMASAIEGFYDYFIGVRDDRRARPRDDLSTLIATAPVPEFGHSEMPLAEVIGYYVVFAVAGHDTSASSIAAGMRALIEHPDQLDRLRADPGLLNSAADEVIRWASPSRHFLRTAAEPGRIGEVDFQAGDTAFLAWPAANRDPDVFADPETFDVGRTHNPHVAFGIGPHFCLGAHLARMEVRAVLAELVRRLDHAELAGEPELVASITAGGLKHLPIRYALK